MKMRYCLFLIASLSSTLLAQTTATKQRAPVPVVSTINDAMQVHVDAGTISGAVTLVSHRGKLVHLGSVGHADLEKQKTMKPSTLFAIASMTKPVVATGVMMLQDEGKLSIDDEVQSYLPAFSNLKLKDDIEPKRSITIRDCLTHTSGLGGKQTAHELPTLEALVDQLAERPLQFQPGTQWSYSPGLNVAGRIIEIVSITTTRRISARANFRTVQNESDHLLPR